MSDDKLRDRAAELAADALKQDANFHFIPFYFSAADMAAMGAPAVPVEVRVIRQITEQEYIELSKAISKKMEIAGVSLYQNE